MFNVDWSDDSLLGEMCQLYLDHPTHRKEITFAADRIESLLRSSAGTLGTEISQEGLRKFRDEPLEVVYGIDGANVEVEAVRWIGFTPP